MLILHEVRWLAQTRDGTDKDLNGEGIVSEEVSKQVVRVPWMFSPEPLISPPAEPRGTTCLWLPVK